MLLFAFCTVTFVTFIPVCLRFLWKHYSYWQRQGCPEIKPIIPFGNLLPFFLGEKSAGATIASLYSKSTAPFVGIYVFFQPQLLIRDVTLVRKVLVEDFEYFYDRNIFINEASDPFSVNSMSQKGEKWKRLRQKLTPLFSAAKMKAMFPTFMDEIDKLDEHLERRARQNEPIGVRSNVIGYVLNVVASVLYGLDVDLIENPNHAFKQMFNNVIEPSSIIELGRQTMGFHLPILLKFLRMYSLPKQVREYFMKLVFATVNHRELNGISRNDLMQQMIELRKDPINCLSMQEIAGNMFTFFIAAADTVSNTVTYCLYEIAKHSEVLEKVQQEVREVLAKNDNNFTYESLQEMKYLDLCIKETLRLHVVLPTLSRLTMKDYKVPGHNFVIRKGTPVVISIAETHMDAQYFPKPMEFIPERFEEGSDLVTEHAYFPFGNGPRQCIANRFGLLVSKAAVARILSKYRISLIDQGEVKIASNTLSLLPKDDIPMNFELIV